MATSTRGMQPVLHLPYSRAGIGRADSAWWSELLWVGGAAVAGFASSAILGGWLELARGWLVLIYGLVTTAVAVGYVRWSDIDLRSLVVRRWPLGVAGAAVVGAFVVMAVERQDASSRPEGARLIWDLFWFGGVYGLVDAVLLSVIPVLATWRAFAHKGWTDHLSGKIEVGALALLASVVVTAAYHLGYPEFRGSDLKDPLFGNGVMSLGYVLTNNPITAIVSHIAMHVAAVLQGAETTVQLPPHY